MLRSVPLLVDQSHTSREQLPKGISALQVTNERRETVRQV